MQKDQDVCLKVGRPGVGENITRGQKNPLPQVSTEAPRRPRKCGNGDLMCFPIRALTLVTDRLDNGTWLLSYY